jgi:hypothetical protein
MANEKKFDVTLAIDVLDTEELRRLINEGIDSPAVDFAKIFARLRARFAAPDKDE